MTTTEKTTDKPQDPIQWLKDTWTQLRNQTEVNWLESEDYWDIEDHEGYQDHYDELLAWREEFEQNKQAEEVEKANRKRLAELEAADKAAKDMTESFYLDPSVRGSKLADVFRMPGPGKPDAVEMTKLYFQYRQTVALETIANRLGSLYQYGITINKPEY